MGGSVSAAGVVIGLAISIAMTLASYWEEQREMKR